ncbi:MAG TPA: hypothetical protein VNZ57_05910, partial [Longimicrobiales bacterium]|nr:hypothetical protein [Longimicrobiales bacterium]
MADDGFERYFAEKIWELIPPVYRHEDGQGENPGVLRSLVEVVASQAAVLRRSQDRLWEDQFVEGASDWAIPYLADLVATRLVSALNPRGRRVDVAKTIYYRRRKGTLGILEELIGDIAGWDGTVVEAFRRLTRTWHHLDPIPDRRLGRVTRTPAGGLPDLRNAGGAELAGTPFDEFHHLPDIRKPRGRDGRYGIHRLNVHLYRVPALRVAGADPAVASGGSGRFTVDPSGRDIALFRPRIRPTTWDEWRAAREWEVQAPIRCRLLNQVEYTLTEAAILRLLDDGIVTAAQADELRTLRGTRYDSDARIRQTLGTLPSAATFLGSAAFRAIRAATLGSECGKAALLPNALRVDVAGVALAPEEIVGADLSAWSVPAAVDATLVVDPARGRLFFPAGEPDSQPAVTYHYGFPASIGAGTYDRRHVEEVQPDVVHTGGGALAAGDIPNDGVARIDDDRTYGPVANKNAVRNLTLQAANQQRPYIRLTDGPATVWRLATGANAESLLTLDGLWIGAAGPASIRLEGDYEHVRIRYSTIDPGGAITGDTGSPELPPVVLEVRGHVELIEIDSCVTGPIRTVDDGVVERLVVRDSIL